MSAPSTPASKQQRLPRNLQELLALLNENPAPADVVERARATKERVLMQFGASASVTASVLFTKCHHHLPTTGVETMAVMLMADHTAAFLYNPWFTLQLGEEGSRFVMFHESRHLIYRHLYNEPHLRADPLFTLACEIGINHDAMERLGRQALPTITLLADHEVVLGDDGRPVVDAEGHTVYGNPVLDPKGQPVTEKTGVDPKGQYDKYVADLKKQGLSPVPYAAFVKTDFGCYTELKRMSNPPRPEQQMAVCLHGPATEGDSNKSGPGAGGQSSDDDENIPMNEDTADSLGQEALRQLMKQAVAGSENAREELLKLAERSEGTSERTSKMWSDLGVGRLRGQTLATRKVDWWKQWLNDALASRLKPGEKLIYNKKRGALDLLLGNDPILGHRGDEEERLALVAIDTSGSMSQKVLDYLTQLVGHTDGVEFRWVAFDGVVEPFVAGEAVHGGGGTNFGNVMDYAEGRLAVNGQTLDIHPDVVLMLTDGYAAPIQPAEPDKWIWLITEGGSDDWIRAQGDMDSHKITTGDGVI